MFKKAKNYVKIEGILSEIDLKTGQFMKNGVATDYISGIVKILVEQKADNVPESINVPVHVFVSKYKNDGGVNNVYTGIEKVMKEFVSIAACGDREKADKVRVTGAEVMMNEFYGQNGELVSSPRIRASYFSKVTGDFKPCATFDLEFFLSEMDRAVDKDGVELDPPVVNLKTVVPQYTSPSADALNVDIVPMKIYSTNVREAAEKFWEVGKCYQATGRLNFSSTTETYKEEVDFGESNERVRTVNVSELIITGGLETPLDDDYAWTINEIKAGVAARKVRLETLKNKKSEKPASVSASVPRARGGKVDLGF